MFFSHVFMKHSGMQCQACTQGRGGCIGMQVVRIIIPESHAGELEICCPHGMALLTQLRIY